MAGLDGLPITVSDSAALAQFNDGVRAFLAYSGVPYSHFEAATKSAPGGAFPLAHIAGGTFLAAFVFGGQHESVIAHVNAIKDFQASGKKLTKRESMHLQAFQTWREGELYKTAKVFDDILKEFPTDILALRFLNDVCIAAGEVPRFKDILARVLPHHDKQSEIYPHILGMYSFALEEAGQRAKAKEVARDALQLCPTSAWTMHALAHVNIELYETDEGIENLEATKHIWSAESCLLNHHLHWHLSLFYFAKGRVKDALAEFDAGIDKYLSELNSFAVVDASALLWRLHLAGVNVGKERVGKLLEIATKTMNNHPSAFYDMHLALVFALNAHYDKAALPLCQTFADSVRRYVAGGKGGSNTETTRIIGQPIADAMVAYASGNFSEVTRVLGVASHSLARLGGSHAQQDVVMATYLSACVRSGDFKEGMEFLNKRIAGVDAKGGAFDMLPYFLPYVSPYLAKK